MTFGGYYAGKKVMVTGHTGFKGSWMTAWLQELGAEVIGLSLAEPPSEPSHFVVANMADSMVSLQGDVRDAATVEAAIDEHRPQVVFHLAAQALVRAAYASPADTFATNVIGTANVLESVHRIGGTEAVVMITSDKCYENNEWLWGYRETDALGGHDPDSASKGAAELVIRTFQDERFQGQAQHRCAIASTRAGNVIGGGDWAVDRLVPDIVASIAAGRDIVVRSPHATRPWQHVLEPLSGYLQLGERLATTGGFRSAYNFGPEMVGGEAVAEIVEALLARWNDSGTKLVIEADDSGRESGLLRLDCSRAKSELGWRPAWPLPVALDHIADWYRTYYRDSNADMAAVTRAQIATYVEDAAAGGIDWATA